MTWSTPADAPITTRIAALAPSLMPSEKLVVDVIAADVEAAVECTAQELAARAGVSRASVIRTAQTLGYEGYPQMRVAVARELASAPAPNANGPDTLISHLQGFIHHFSAGLSSLTTALTESDVDAFLSALDSAPRVAIVATGLSAPLGLDAAMRLNAAGRPAEYLPDPLAQQIASQSLGPGSVCLVISGSGVTRDSLDAAETARASGATVLAMTSFARAPIVAASDVALVIPPVSESFTEELLHTSRAALALTIEALVRALVRRRGADGEESRSDALTLIEKRLSE